MKFLNNVVSGEKLKKSCWGGGGRVQKFCEPCPVEGRFLFFALPYHDDMMMRTRTHHPPPPKPMRNLSQDVTNYPSVTLTIPRGSNIPWTIGRGGGAGRVHKFFGGGVKKLDWAEILHAAFLEHFKSLIFF